MSIRKIKRICMRRLSLLEQILKVPLINDLKLKLLIHSQGQQPLVLRVKHKKSQPLSVQRIHHHFLKVRSLVVYYLRYSRIKSINLYQISSGHSSSISKYLTQFSRLYHQYKTSTLCKYFRNQQHKTRQMI